MKKFAVLFLGIMVVAGCSQQISQNQNLPLPTQQVPNAPETTEFNPASWETYASKKYNFTMKYPHEFQVNEGILLKGTGSEHYSIGFSKGFEYGFMAIAPDSTHGSRGVEKARSYEQIIDGKKAFIEEWQAGDGGSTINLKFLDPIDKWKMCDESEFCEHITFFGSQKSDSEIFKKMISTIKFF